MLSLIAQLSIGGMGIGQLAIAIVCIAALCALVYIGLQFFGVTVPAVVQRIFWVIVVALMLVCAIKIVMWMW